MDTLKLIDSCTNYLIFLNDAYIDTVPEEQLREFLKKAVDNLPKDDLVALLINLGDSSKAKIIDTHYCEQCGYMSSTVILNF